MQIFRNLVLMKRFFLCQKKGFAAEQNHRLHNRRKRQPCRYWQFQSWSICCVPDENQQSCECHENHHCQLQIKVQMSEEIKPLKMFLFLVFNEAVLIDINTAAE